jgi:hypothetical protein
MISQISDSTNPVCAHPIFLRTRPIVANMLLPGRGGRGENVLPATPKRPLKQKKTPHVRTSLPMQFPVSVLVVNHVALQDYSTGQRFRPDF